MPPNMRSVIANATRGGRSVLSRRNFYSSRLSEAEMAAEKAAWCTFFKNSGRLAYFLIGYSSYGAWQLVQIREYHFTLLKAVDKDKEHKELWQQIIRNHKLK